MSPSSPTIRRELHYSGHVQGVGFRMTVHQIAKRFAVDGIVRNLVDGRVHLVVEGEPVELQQFLDVIRDKMAHNIRDVSDDIQMPSGEFSGFSICY